MEITFKRKKSVKPIKKDDGENGRDIAKVWTRVVCSKIVISLDSQSKFTHDVYFKEIENRLCY